MPKTNLAFPKLTAFLKAHRCVWYPSAGGDFRDIMFLSGKYPGIDVEPELFIHTDCDASFMFYKKDFIVYQDERTTVRAVRLQNFERLHPVQEFADFQCAKTYNGRTALFQISIDSDTFGHIERKLLYAVCENEWFAGNIFVPQRIPIDTICRIRYGNGFGGALNDGSWLISAMNVLKTKNFFSDPEINLAVPTADVLDRYPCMNVPPVKFQPGLVIPSSLWSYSGDVTWYQTCPAEN